MKLTMLGALGICSATLVVAQPIQAAPVLPSFNVAAFTPGAAIDNQYFPLLDNLTRAWQGEAEINGQTVVERFEHTVIGVGPTLLGVQTTTLRDRSFVNGVIKEDTFDYYAQDNSGNVWYFGEDVTNYRYDSNGNFLGTDSHSSWISGIDNALPGHVMPADLPPALNYFQEFAPFNAALDHGTVLTTGYSLDLDIGHFDNVLVIWEGSLTAPFGTNELKYYAPGIGLIATAEGLDLELQNPVFFKELQAPSAVPLPAPLALLGSALAGLTGVSRRKAKLEVRL
jgi:hypothetical protein